MAREKGNHPLFDWEEVQVGGVITLNLGANMEVVEIKGPFVTMRDEMGQHIAVAKNDKYFWNARYVE